MTNCHGDGTGKTLSESMGQVSSFTLLLNKPYPLLLNYQHFCLSHSLPLTKTWHPQKCWFDFFNHVLQAGMTPSEARKYPFPVSLAVQGQPAPSLFH